MPIASSSRSCSGMRRAWTSKSRKNKRKIREQIDTQREEKKKEKERTKKFRHTNTNWGEKVSHHVVELENRNNKPPLGGKQKPSNNKQASTSVNNQRQRKRRIQSNWTNYWDIWPRVKNVPCGDCAHCRGERRCWLLRRDACADVEAHSTVADSPTSGEEAMRRA